MNGHEVKFAEAVAVLRKRLDDLGVDTAAAVAQDFMHDLVQQGWRPSARPVEDRHHRLDPDRAVTPEQRRAYAEQARKEMAEHRFQPREEV